MRTCANQISARCSGNWNKESHFSCPAAFLTKRSEKKNSNFFLFRSFHSSLPIPSIPLNNQSRFVYSCIRLLQVPVNGPDPTQPLGFFLVARISITLMVPFIATSNIIKRRKLLLRAMISSPYKISPVRFLPGDQPTGRPAGRSETKVTSGHYY